MSAPPSTSLLPRETNSLHNPEGSSLPRVADFVAEQLARWGARLVFGVPGTDNMAFLDAVHRHPLLRFCPVRHEGAAALMASAAAKLTGQITVCTATSGPGTAGLINGLGDAFTDGAPVIAVTGQVESRHLGSRASQYVDQQQLLSPVTGQSVLVVHPHSVGSLLTGAMRTAVSRSIPAHVSVPRDVWQQPTNAAITGPEPYLFTPRRSPHHVVKEAARLLSEAERPVLVVGLGAARAITDVLKLAEHLDAPIVHTLPVAGKIPWQHPLSVGSFGEGGSEAATRLLEDADWVFRIGANWWPEDFTPRGGFRMMALDIRPDHLGSGAGAHFGIVGDCGEILPELTALLTHRDRDGWRRRVAEARSRWIDVMAEESGYGDGPRFHPDHSPDGMHPGFVVAELSAALPHDAVICLDVGDHVIWFNRLFQGSGQEVVLSGSWRTVGFALPAALAARIVDPHRPVVAVTGDGGFAMSLTELGTAAQLRLPVTIVLLRNEVYASEVHQAEREGLYPAGTKVENPDFGRLIGAWGGAAYRADRPDEVRRRLQAALESRTVALVDIPVRPIMPPPFRRRATVDIPAAGSVTHATV